ncbi:MAG: FG-GAP-like repeat-containing protein [Bacteroidota bacterium]|jgi:hypothetical protein
MKNVIKRGLVHAVLLLCSIPLLAQEFPLRKTADLPDYSIKMWTDVWRPDILMFGRWIAPLGDINHDGYDDIAVASFADTTFIFLGGEEFSHEPITFLLGGGGGIAAGDFNGDGRMDLATAIVQLEHRLGEPDPGDHGKIRFFLGKDTAIPFDTIPDLTLIGKARESLGFIPNGKRSGIVSLDYNGDGFSDLLVVEFKLDTIPTRRMAMYLGASKLDSLPAAYIQARDDLASLYFNDDMMIGDVNGDGFDDVLVHSNYVSPVHGLVNYWDLHLGNALLQTDRLDRVLSSETGWAPRNGGQSNLVDINADGYDDIFDSFFPDDPGDIRLFLSSSDLPEIILPNDTIPNTDRLGLRRPGFICPTGDMNGDGWEDVLVGWSDQFFRYGILYLLYPGGPSNKYKTPLGVFGILLDEHYLTLGAYKIGDVNGDGCDDVAVLGMPTIGNSPKQYRFRIYLGSREMQTSVSPLPQSHPLQIGVHPNPVRTTQGHVTVSTASTDVAAVDLVLTDILGRQILRTSIDVSTGNQSTNLPVNELSPGIYCLMATQSETRVYQSVIIF